MLSAIQNKIEHHFPISLGEARWLFEHLDTTTLSQLASAVRMRFHPKDEATYLIMAIINYTNICVAACDYCAFYRLPHEPEAYLKSFEEIAEKIEKVRSLGGTLAGFNGGFHPRLRIQDYAELFSKVHNRFPDMTFYEMTVAEFMFSCKISKLSYAEGASVLKQAGTKWITGGGAEILDDAFRKRHSPGKFKVEDYFMAQAAILDAGLGSTATMVIGFDESLDERFSHLERLRAFQETQSRKLTSFLCWTYKPYHTRLGGGEISTEEYLRWMATCRIYLDNFVHFRTSVLTKNESALLGLNFGANDFDLPIEDEVTEKAGAVINLDFDAVIAAVHGAGFKAIKRNPFSEKENLVTIEARPGQKEGACLNQLAHHQGACLN